MLASRSEHPSERGAGLVEYSLLIALILLGALAGLTYFGDENSKKLSEATDSIIAS